MLIASLFPNSVLFCFVLFWSVKRVYVNGQSCSFVSTLQARALTAQTAETDAIRFLVGTQSLKFDNQVRKQFKTDITFHEKHDGREVL